MMAECSLDLTARLYKAAQAIRNAEGLVIMAGAGMGVDSGLPDFRGNDGLYTSYKPFQKFNLSFAQMCNPRWFTKDPEFAWGFFSHFFLYHLFCKTDPHNGFHILKRWGERMKHGYFVQTSNIDGHFQKAGYDDNLVYERHGSIHYLQCTDPGISKEVWPVTPEMLTEPDMDMKMTPPLPKGPPGLETNLARPNVLMFGDIHHVSKRTEEQRKRYEVFTERLVLSNYVVIEIGAGTSIPSIRIASEELAQRYSLGRLIRINVSEADVPEDICDGAIGLPMKGSEALEKIDAILQEIV